MTLDFSKVKFSNLTKHSINVLRGNDMLLEVPPSGLEARVDEGRISGGCINGAKLAVVIRGDVVDLPAPVPNVFYLVSKQVLFHASVEHRKDILAPDDIAYDPTGRIKGCRGFIGNASMTADMVLVDANRNGRGNTMYVYTNRHDAGVALLEMRHELTAVKLTDRGNTVRTESKLPSVRWVLDWMSQ